MSKPFILYGTPGSLYTAKVRSFLRKQRIVFEEHPSGSAHFRENIAPLVGRWIMPVLETPTGTLIQDGADILDYFDQSMGLRLPLMPESPSLAVISHLFELFGGEGLLRPAMHYRWNFDKENLAFLKEDLPGFIAAGADDKTRSDFFEFASGLMRKATVALGVNPHLIPQIEESYAEFLQLFSAHLRTAPYLLGGLPSNGDFALAGPLWPHLARDPYPAGLMQRTAWPVYRWTERISAPVNDTGEYIDYPEELFVDDSIPETLVELMKYVAAEMLPELVAQVGFMDEHLAADPEITDGSVVGGKPSRRSIGKVTFEWRGQEMTTSVLPYRVFLLQRLQAAVAGRSEAERAEIETLFAECGLEVLLTLKPRRTVERRDNCEVWGAEQEACLQVA